MTWRHICRLAPMTWTVSLPLLSFSSSQKQLLKPKSTVKMASGGNRHLVSGLKALFLFLFCSTAAALIYAFSLDGFPFPDRKHIFTPWFVATIVDFYINVVPIAVWISYKESNWIGAVIWIVLLVIFGSLASCAYIFLQLVKLTPQESLQDPLYHLLLRDSNNDGTIHRTKQPPVICARVIFGALGCLMVGTLLYTLLTDGSPFRKELLYPWMVALLVNFYVNVAALSVWVFYKESSWISAVLWIVLLICLGSISTSAYIVVQLLRLSSQDPLYLVLLNNDNRAENKYERTSC